MNKLAFSTLIDYFVWIPETIGVVWFFVRCSSFRVISNCVPIEKRCIYI
jgi:hypothetical protein